MLIKSYSYYFFAALYEALLSLPGAIAALLLIGGLYFLLVKRGAANKRLPAAVMAVVGLAVMTWQFYAAEVVYPQSQELLQVAKENADDKDCGGAATDWTTSGIGMTNPCKKGCYRGITIEQRMRMRHFPPWPENKREFQCWHRSSKPSATAAKNLP